MLFYALSMIYTKFLSSPLVSHVAPVGETGNGSQENPKKGGVPM